MIRGTFTDEDLPGLIRENGTLPVCFLHCLIKFKYFESFKKIVLSPNAIDFFPGSSDKAFALDCLFEEIAQIADDKVKHSILRCLLLLKGSNVFRGYINIYLADESGHGILDLSANEIAKYDYHVFNNLFGISPLAERFTRDMQTNLITHTPGTKTFVQSLRKTMMTEKGYKRMVKGLSGMFSVPAMKLNEMLITNAEILLTSFLKFGDQTDNRCLIRELALDKNIPYDVKEGVLPILKAIRAQDPLPLVKSLVDLHANAREIMLVIAMMVGNTEVNQIWECLELVADHPEHPMILSPVLNTLLGRHSKDTIIQVASTKVNGPAYIIRPLLATLGSVILKDAKVVETLHDYFAGIKKADLISLLPMLFSGILSHQQIRDLRLVINCFY